MCVDGRGLSKTLSFKPSASLRGACKLEHYITRGVVSRPNLSQWTIPLPEFMFCPEGEAGETKQTCREVYDFGGDSITKHCIKDFLRPWNIVFMAGCLAELRFLWERTVTHPALRSHCEDERRSQKKKSSEKTEKKTEVWLFLHKCFSFLSEKSIFKCGNI